MKKILIIIISITLFTCDDQADSANPNLGNLVGAIDLIDENGQPLVDKSGVIIELENTSLKTTTDVNGRFELNNIPEGTYNLYMDKKDFSTYNKFDMLFVRGKIPVVLDITLYERPGAIVNYEIVEQHAQSVEFNIEFPATSNYSSAKVYVNKSPNVSDTSFYEQYGSNWSIGNLFSFMSLGAPFPDIFSPGDKIYIAVYRKNYFDNGYFDNKNSTVVYSSIAKPEFTIPYTIQ